MIVAGWWGGGWAVKVVLAGWWGGGWAVEVAVSAVSAVSAV